MGCMCTETSFRCARQRFRMWLAVLQLHHGRRSAAAAPELAAVDGSDPPFGDASIGIAEGWHVHAHATLRRGVGPVSISPSREGGRGSGWRWASTSFSLARR